MNLLNRILKRLFDICISIVLVILLLPFLLFNSLLIKILMGGKIFYFQKRIGLNEKEFNIIKFRSMRPIVVNENLNDTERLTKYGIFMRRFKIDELPQLFNVLVGDMSIVGPRPTIKEQVDRYNNFQKRRLKMKPGMTGLAQVNGNIHLDWSKRIEFDVKYIENFSIILDFKIIFKTLLIVIMGEKTFHRK